MLDTQKPKRRFASQILSAYIITLSMVYIYIFCIYHDNNTFYISSDPQKNTVDPFRHIVEPATRFIASWALRKWSRSEYLIVFGILSDDNPPRQRRRDLQREHCWSYDGVATLRNQYSGVMPVLYVMGRSPLHQFKYSPALENEARAWQDLLTLPIDEGRKSTNKQIGDGGFWGTEAAIGMSRKVFLWFYLSRQLFPKALYVAKGDDDAFFRVPAYLGTLRLLPRKGIYWGYLLLRTPAMVGAVTRNNSKFFYANGPCVTLAKDIVEKFISYEPLRRMIFLPYNKSIISKFNAFVMQAEDIMVGLAVHSAAYPNIVYVKEALCRMHDVHSGAFIRPVTSDSVVVHHIKEPEYRRLRELFQNETSCNTSITHRNEFEIKFKCHSNVSSLSL